VTTDPRFAHIFVTELQTIQVVPAALAARSTSDTNGSLTASAKYLIQRSWNLSYDFSALVAHSNGLATENYSILNGLSASRRLTPTVGVTGRLDRSDSGGTSSEHQALNRATASLTYDPLPALGAGATYSAVLSQTTAGSGLTNGVSGFARADLYQGITVTTNGSVNYGQNDLGQTVQSALWSAGATVTPHRALALTAIYNYTTSTTTGGGRPEASQALGQVQGTASFTPFRALYFAASVSRYTSGQAPSTLASFSGGFSPFPGGDLSLQFAYNESYDQSTGTRARQYGPTARWNIRPGTFLDVAYSVQDSQSPALDSNTRAITANLNVALH
jgi:hypothetical protein